MKTIPILLAFTLVAPAVAMAKEKPRLLALDFTVASGVDPEAIKLLENLLVTRLQQIGRHQVVSQSDIKTMLGVERQKLLIDCSDASCMAEIGGALGAKWLVLGTVDRLGEDLLMTLKLLDVDGSRLDNQISQELPSDQGRWPDVVFNASHSLLGIQAPVRKTESAWYQNPWLWAGVGAGLILGGTGIYFMSRPETAPDSTYGEVVLDAIR